MRDKNSKGNWCFCRQIVSSTRRAYQRTTFNPKNIKDHLAKTEQLSWKHLWKWVKLQGDILHRFFWLVYGPLLQFSFKQLYKLGILSHCLIDYSITLISKERATVADPLNGKKIFWDRDPPLSMGVGDHAPCLSQGLVPVLNKILYYSLTDPSLEIAPTSGLYDQSCSKNVHHHIFFVFF